jgi:hypothetical protein
VVVLEEFLGDSELGEGVAAIGLLKEAPVIAVDDGLDQDRTLQTDRERAHDRAIYPRCGGDIGHVTR